MHRHHRQRHGPRSGRVTVVQHKALTANFQVSCETIEHSKSGFGHSAVHGTGQYLPKGWMPPSSPHTLRDDAKVSAAPEMLGNLPTLAEGRWVAIGERLVKICPDNSVAIVLDDALP